jgi:hypothetical protein
MMKKIILLVCFVISLNFIQAIEVSGHLTEDTTWSPENNPYEIVNNLYVDTGVTLTILPGTIIKIKSKLLTNSDIFMQNFYYSDNNDTAKLIWVDGQIIAEGTVENPIQFLPSQELRNYHWGIIYIREEADACSFKHCEFYNSSAIIIALGNIPIGAICMHNSEVLIDQCKFVDNFTGVYTGKNPNSLQITNSNFYQIHGITPNVYSSTPVFMKGYFLVPESNTLIAGNKFHNLTARYHLDLNADSTYNIAYNSFRYNYAIDASRWADFSSFYIYNNYFLQGGSSTSISGTDSENNLYIKKNTFSGNAESIYISSGSTVEISDNDFGGSYVNAGFLIAEGRMYNNKFNGGNLITDIDCFQNIFTNRMHNIHDYPYFGQGERANLVIVNNRNWYAQTDNRVFTNCIIVGNNKYSFYNPSEPDTFKNCILDFPLEPPLVDAGGNIIVDSLQAQEIFVDMDNGDFRLADGSIAIDAGYDAQNFPVDFQQALRIWDGDGNGEATIDIGVYEYGAPQLGKVTGYITQTGTGEPVDYVQIKTNNDLENFTYADSSGYFELKLPEGSYELYAKRVFYDDNIIYNIDIEDGQTSEITFEMTYNDPIVNLEENVNNTQQIDLMNYPNPFNPKTTICFKLPEESYTELSVYNLKGQKIKRLTKERLKKGTHTIVWNGDNEIGQNVASGVYFYRIMINNKLSITKKCLLVK